MEHEVPASPAAVSTGATLARDAPPSTQSTQSTSSSPLLAIWRRPSTTFRWLLERSSHRGVLLLAALSPCAFAPPGSFADDHAAVARMVNAASLTGVMIAAVGLLFLRGTVIAHVGQWLGGNASSPQVRLAIAWSSLPLVAVAVGHAPLLVLPGDNTLWTLVVPPAVAWALWNEVKFVALAHEMSRARAAIACLMSALLPLAAFVAASSLAP